MKPTLQLLSREAIEHLLQSLRVLPVELPQHLAHDSHPYRYVGCRQAHAQHEPPQLFFAAVRRMPSRISRLLQRLPEDRKEALHFSRGGGNTVSRPHRSILKPDQFIE